VDEKEYEKFMIYLYDEYVRSGDRKMARKYLHPMELGYECEKLVRASNLLRYINRHCRSEDEIYRTIKMERIEELQDEVNHGTRVNRRMLEESGFMEVIDSHYDEIVSGMKLEHMPPQEIETMRCLGSNNPETELSALISIVKSKQKSQHSYKYNELQVSQQLKNLEQKLEQQEKQLENNLSKNQDKQKKTRRWFKGLGQIAQGSALSIANVGLAMGAITVPVAAETASWGAIVSSITGVGMVLNGIGEFKGE